MLEGVQSQIGEIGGLGMAIDAYHATLFMEAIEHLVCLFVRHGASFSSVSGFKFQGSGPSFSFRAIPAVTYLPLSCRARAVRHSCCKRVTGSRREPAISSLLPPTSPKTVRGVSAMCASA